MREQSTAAHHMMEQMERRSKENLDGHNGGVEIDLEYLKFAEFWKVNMPSFRGTYNLDQADGWIKAIKKVFTMLPYTEQRKVAFATYILEVDAKFWRTSTKRLLESA